MWPYLRTGVGDWCRLPVLECQVSGQLTPHGQAWRRLHAVSLMPASDAASSRVVCSTRRAWRCRGCATSAGRPRTPSSPTGCPRSTTARRRPESPCSRSPGQSVAWPGRDRNSMGRGDQGTFCHFFLFKNWFGWTHFQ